MFLLQGDTATVESAIEELGLAPPTVANTMTHSGTLDVFWVGRARWLLRCPLDAEDRTRRRLAPLRETRGTDAVCVSDYYTGFVLDGPDTRALLTQTCPLDLHASVFGVGCATFTSVFSLRGLLHFESPPTTYALYVEGSFAEYVQGCFESVVC
jgi:heterotetrameric sarcosine oxidase gamma subunit